jgi:hypothetical protein
MYCAALIGFGEAVGPKSAGKIRVDVSVFITKSIVG